MSNIGELASRNAMLRKKIKALQKARDYSNEQMAMFLGVSARTYSRKLNNLRNMKVVELMLLEKALKTKFLDTTIGEQ